MPDTPGSAMDTLCTKTGPGRSLCCFWKSLVKNGQYPLGKRNTRCKREFQSRRDSWAGAKEKQEAYLGRRNREQEMSRKGGETGDARPGGGVWAGAGMKTSLNRIAEKTYEMVPHPKWQWPLEEPTQKKWIKNWGAASQKGPLLIHNPLNCLEFPNFFFLFFFFFHDRMPFLLPQHPELLFWHLREYSSVLSLFLGLRS